MRWHFLEDGAARLAVAHFKTWGACIRRRPVLDRRHPGALTPHAFHRPCSHASQGAGQLQQAASRVGGSRRRQPTGICWRPTSPGATCIWQPPPGAAPARRGMTSSPPYTTTGLSPTTRGGRSSRRRSAGTTGAASAPACWRSGTPSDRGGTTSGSAISTLGRRPPTSHTPATFVGNATRCPPCRCAPRWPRAPGPNLPQARTGAQRRRLCTGASGEHTPPHTNPRAPRAPHPCGSTSTCETPRPLCTCCTCSRPDRHPPPHLAEPAAPCLADGGTDRDTPRPAAKHRRRPSGAW